MVTFCTNPEVNRVHKMDEAAKLLGFEFGRNTLYKIFKELKIVNSHNVPAEEYQRLGLLKLVVPELQTNPRFKNHPVTLIVGTAGLNFVKEKVEEYFRIRGSPPKAKRERKYVNPINENSW